MPFSVCFSHFFLILIYFSSKLIGAAALLRATAPSKIKHRDEIAPIYKEYKSKSGWSQSRFRKKNADVIEDYEKTVNYIKEHQKPFYVDGKMPTMLDLLDKSNTLKSQYNVLLAEHEVFVIKRDTAIKYTKQVKKYLDEQYMKRERKRSQ